jgi:two-component system phosphate regulon sensor histidine kinase PhoR
MDELALILLLTFVAMVGLLLWRWEYHSRRQAERELRRSQQSLQNEVDQITEKLDALKVAFDSSDSMLLVVGRQNRVLTANPLAEDRFGPLKQDSSLMSFTRSAQLEQLAQDAFELPEGGSFVRVISLGDQPHRVVARVKRDAVGLVISNITEIRRLSRARQDMVANLSHELRTPLTSLRLLADTLRSPAGGDAEVAAELIQKIGAEVDELEQIGQEMLDLSAIESGQQVVRMVSEPLTEILNGPLARVEEKAKRRGVTLTVRVAGELRVLVDRDQASRALLNVLQNAVKFTAEDSEVVLEAWFDETADDVILAISDEGPGVHPAEIDRIFERFFRGDRARVASGTGLGLAIARHILRAHGGRIWVENRNPPDLGAIFYLAFQRG